MYALFATPDVRARSLFYDPTGLRGRWIARLVLLLDWLARFDVKPWAPDDLRRGHAIVGGGRGGTRATGTGALPTIAAGSPLPFVPLRPPALVAGLTAGREADPRGRDD